MAIGRRQRRLPLLWWGGRRGRRRAAGGSNNAAFYMHQPLVLGALFPINQSDPASPPSKLAFILWAFPAFPELILLRLQRRRQCNFAKIHNVSRLARAMTAGEGEWGENEATGWLLMKGRFATVPSLHALSVFIAFMPLVFGTPLVITIITIPSSYSSECNWQREGPKVEFYQQSVLSHSDL